MRRKGAPGEAPRLHGEPAGDEQCSKTAEREYSVFAQAFEFDKRAEQDKEKCTNQKSQLAVKRQHLPVMLRLRTAMLLLDGRLGKPVDILRVIAELETLLRCRIIRER